ncbi:MAG: glycosyltransferase family 2 protein [Candidatus Dormibacteria bacterium]
MTGGGQVAVVLVNWNGGRDCERVLASIRAQTLPVAEVVVVDNASQDGSCQWFERQAGVLVIRNPSNRGFAVAVNQGISATDADLVLLCNLDVVLDPGFVAALVARMQTGPDIGSVGGRLRREGPGHASDLDSTGHVLHRSGWVSNRGHGESGPGRYLDAEEVFGVSAAAALYRRSMLLDVAIGGEIFCERFFAYLEDVDLDWRARWRGWRSYYEPAATASHRRGGTGLHATAMIERHVLANRISLYCRNAPPSWLGGRPLLSAASLILLRAGLALGRHPSSWLGLVDAGRWWRRSLRDRRTIMDGRRVADPAIEKWAQPTPWRRLLGAHVRG